MISLRRIYVERIYVMTNLRRIHVGLYFLSCNIYVKSTSFSFAPTVMINPRRIYIDFYFPEYDLYFLA